MATDLPPLAISMPCYLDDEKRGSSIFSRIDNISVSVSGESVVPEVISIIEKRHFNIGPMMIPREAPISQPYSSPRIKGDRPHRPAVTY